MLISIVIPTYNRNDLLSNCLDLLDPAVQHIDKTGLEVIVSDDSKDNKAKALIQEKYKWATWVPGPQKGPAANRNNGAKVAKGDWLLFIDDDCLPNKDIVLAYVNAINDFPEIVAFEGRIYVDEPQTSFLQECPINETGGYFWSCNICIKNGFFKKMNGFDESFPYAAMEDVDFFLRIRQQNAKHMFLHNAAVLHPWRKNQKLFSTILNRYKSELRYIEIHPEAKKTFNFKFYVRAFLMFFGFTLKNSWKFRFAGFGKKIQCDFLQLYFAFLSLSR